MSLALRHKTSAFIMNIVLSINNSEKNKVGKSLTSETTFSGSLKDETSITSPVFILETENPTNFNYAYIPQFNRYYFITDMVSVRTNLWRIRLSVDVLESFKTEIRNQNVILSASEDNGASNYLNGSQWRNKVKTLTDIINFSSGLNDSGEYILITVGG